MPIKYGSELFKKSLLDLVKTLVLTISDGEGNLYEISIPVVNGRVLLESFTMRDVGMLIKSDLLDVEGKVLFTEHFSVVTRTFELEEEPLVFDE